MLTAAGHDVALINPVIARHFQQTRLERTKTDSIGAASLARLAFEQRPEPTLLHAEVTESLRELIREFARRIAPGPRARTSAASAT